jgi:hypothetical protein
MSRVADGSGSSGRLSLLRPRLCLLRKTVIDHDDLFDLTSNERVIHPLQVLACFVSALPPIFCRPKSSHLCTPLVGTVIKSFQHGL